MVYIDFEPDGCVFTQRHPNLFRCTQCVVFEREYGPSVYTEQASDPGGKPRVTNVATLQMVVIHISGRRRSSQTYIKHSVNTRKESNIITGKAKSRRTSSKQTLSRRSSRMGMRTRWRERPSVQHIVLRTHVQGDLQVVVFLEVIRLRAANVANILGQPDDRQWSEQFWGIQDPRHLLCVVRERQRR